MGGRLEGSLKPSAEELRDVARKLLEERRVVSNRHKKRSLAQRAFELVQLAEQIEIEASKPKPKPKS